jgi:uncharacterized 2Fe-2S/4Fe-4S cluster protein (DUF4445 family)
MASPDPLLIFTPSGRRGHFSVGTTVLDAARRLGVDIDSVCGGRGICGRCQVQQSLGQFPKHGIVSDPSHLSPPDAIEADYAARKGLSPGRRLACTAALRGDAVIDVPATSQVHRQVVRKELEVRPFDLDPVTRLYYVEADQPDLASPRSDLARVEEALAREWGLRDLGADVATIRAVQHAVEVGNGKLTVAVHAGRALIAAWPLFHDRAFGVAIDIGSTTIAGHLASLLDGSVLATAGVMNPQIRFGEDLMSRVSYAMLHERGAAEMTAAVRTALRDLIGSLAGTAGVARDEILEVVLVGNPIMHHLALGLDPTPLGQAPFTLATEAPVHAAAAELRLGIHPGARVYVLPCIAGHVGADTAGVILAEQPHLAEAVTLIVDVGTNAELVLGNRNRLLAASSPTGPAFEGAQISAGQRAAPGAIERVRIDALTLEPRFRVIGCPLWSDEPGFDEATAETGISGICGSGIIDAIAELFLAGVVTADGVVDGALATRTHRIVEDGRTFSYLLSDREPRILITQADVRAIQLAKAALYAGAQLLMEAYGVDAVDEVRLAGAFGSHIDLREAMVLGLVPDCALDRARSVGNAAGAGALIALLSGAARSEIERVVGEVTKLETAIEPRFQEHFVDALAIPHRTATYPNLGRVVALPSRSAPARLGRDARTDRRRPVAAQEDVR